MDNSFNDDEKLYRAVYDRNKKPSFWKRDGSLSSAALLTDDGLSVERGDYREDNTVLYDMAGRLKGLGVAFYVGDCRNTDAVVLYKPTRSSKYHSEVHESSNNEILSPEQRLYIASCAVVVGTIPEK